MFGFGVGGLGEEVSRTRSSPTELRRLCEAPPAEGDAPGKSVRECASV